MAPTPLLAAAGAIVAVVLVIIATCQRPADTPAQALAQERWQACARPGADGLEGVDADGRIRFRWVTMHDRDAVLECLRRANSPDARLPDPLVLDPVGR